MNCPAEFRLSNKKAYTLAFVALLSGSIYAQDGHKNDQGPPPLRSRVAYEHVYENRKYGFSMRFPDGWTAWGDPSPLPNHGITFALDISGRPSKLVDDPLASIWVSGHYTFDPGVATLAAVVDGELQAAKINDKNFSLASEVKTKLGELDAIHLTMRYQKSERNVVEDRIVAVRPGPNGEVPIVYELVLLAPEEVRSVCIPTFKTVADGFQIVEPE